MIHKEIIHKVAQKLKEYSKCPKHPKYVGKGEPPRGCEECLKTYIERLKTHPRSPHRPTKLIPDKSKYQRKEKFKKDWE